MPQRKKTQTKRSTTKKAGTRPIGKTARARATMPRTAKGWAALLEAREARTPGFLREVWGILGASTTNAPPRVAQVEPRTH